VPLSLSPTDLYYLRITKDVFVRHNPLYSHQGCKDREFKKQIEELNIYIGKEENMLREPIKHIKDLINFYEIPELALSIQNH